ncbi:hypothetical protein IR083_23010 [Dysgonomonas sp. GY75]|uniref:hypothetical protein n=1 Tax=Dysgonomonas sp. GY75 TaxID=2780419 RepID=UPI00188391AA|nr:hypothetical protein [Dysgonomonas sp. GY75]MBF0651692.1 hypothetical protein [Dysgonomonas sp. GY75]
MSKELNTNQQLRKEIVLAILNNPNTRIFDDKGYLLDSIVIEVSNKFEEYILKE